jgi:hypothetical protein
LAIIIAAAEKIVQIEYRTPGPREAATGFDCGAIQIFVESQLLSWLKLRMVFRPRYSI